MNSPDLTILLVEDNPDDVLLMKWAFSKANLVNPLQVVEDGEQAVAYLSGDGPYADRSRYPLPVLVLLDLKLPRKSGLEVLHWVRQQPGLKRLRIVVLTSSNQKADINQAHELGANSYLVKPGTLDSLIEMLKTVDLYWMITSEKPDTSV
jgi:CheY-like chemotaxis protein